MTTPSARARAASVSLGALLTMTCLACETPPAALPPQPSTSASVPPPPDPAAAARRAFENPGGMWTPGQISEHASTLRQLGVQLDPATLSDPMAFPLGAVVWLGGCSASFVSPEGLIITNHHCAGSALQFNSSKQHNLLRDGFLAQNRGDEPSAGPTERVYVTEAFVDVTSSMRAGIDAIVDDLARYRTLQDRQKKLVAECEAPRKDLRCDVVSYFGDEQYMLIKQLEIRDVRLVYAPPYAVGAFGGEIDNWRWPRHAGDVAMLRAYVSPDGSPADFSADNVPYRPKHHLKLATQPLRPGDFVMVAGYPGRTTRLNTAEEVTETVDWYYPRRERMCSDYIALLERLGANDQELAIKAERLLRGLHNTLTNTKGQLDGLDKGGLKNDKLRLERELLSWIASHPEHAAASTAIGNLAAHSKRYRGQRDSDAATREAVWMSTLLGAADGIVHMAQERPKPDAARHPDYQARNHARLKQRQLHAQQSYSRQLDQEKLKLALLRAARLPAEQQPLLLKLIVGRETPNETTISAALDRLYDGSQLHDVTLRVKLLESATLAELRSSKDTFIQLAIKLRPLLAGIDAREDAYQGATALDRPHYVAALRAQAGGLLAPDANSTLRVTYGTVRGYRPSPQASSYHPFTKLSEMIAKHTGRDPFAVPAAVLAAAKSPSAGAYRDSDLGEVPVNFLADLDITGGNSGSATLNARGELVGLVFDGNYESMASDWLFMPAITRSIHVDLRYVLWLLDRVAHARTLLTELGVKPAF